MASCLGIRTLVKNGIQTDFDATNLFEAWITAQLDWAIGLTACSVHGLLQSRSGRLSPDAGLASVSTRAVPAFATNRRQVALRA